MKRKNEQARVLIPKPNPRICSCGQIFLCPPQDSIIAEYDEGKVFLQFNCKCGSTRCWPVEIRKVA